jgi:two-component system, chemotaxis family, protein-glutamate methylesterase/glutaminase
MARRDIVVIGASLGGFEALPFAVSSLPADFPASLIIVMHMGPTADSYLAERLDAAGALRAAPAKDGEPIKRGRIYVAVPDRHLMIEDDHIRLSPGPRENHARPSIDALFRSAALCCGPRVIGVVLTGMLDDGTAGLWTIKDKGGIAIAQSPKDAAYPSMPVSAISHVKVDHVVTLADLPELLRKLTREQIAEPEAVMSDRKLEIENQIASDKSALESGVRSLGTPSFYTCPDCHGSMIEIDQGRIRRFRCHTGHAYTARGLSTRSLRSIKHTLWAVLAQLEERQVLVQELERSIRESGDEVLAASYAADSRETGRMLTRLREIAHDPMLNAPAEPDPD